MVKLVDCVTAAGGVMPIEDRAGHRGTLAWVIDGATDLYGDAALPAVRDVHWLVDFLADRLREAGKEGYRGPAAALLEDVADEICRQQRAHNFPLERLPPACSLSMLIDRGTTFEISRIGDATAVVTGAGSTVLATEFFDRRETAAVGVQRNGQDASSVRTAMLERRLYTMTGGDVESVFSGHPQRQLRPHSLVVDWTAAASVLLCTDGFARLLTDYAIFQQWDEVVSQARAHGLGYLVKQLRELETEPTNGRLRFKRSDDVAAVLIESDLPA